MVTTLIDMKQTTNNTRERSLKMHHGEGKKKLDS